MIFAKSPGQRPSLYLETSFLFFYINTLYYISFYLFCNKRLKEKTQPLSHLFFQMKTNM